MTGLHNLIIPRVNINSKESISYAIELVKEYDFDYLDIFSGSRYENYMSKYFF